MITQELQEYIDKSVLCWLATVDQDHCPNVSPKELFLSVDEQTLAIAHIASPQSIKNIQHNPQVCVSFVDVFVQKGYKIKGKAVLIQKTAEDYKDYLQLFQKQYGTAFPMTAFIVINITATTPIVAPSYVFFSNTKEKDQIKSALTTYKVQALLDASDS